MDKIWELIINLLEVFIIYILFNNRLDRKDIPHSTRWQAITLISQALLLFLFNHLSIHILFTQIFFIILHFVYAKIFFRSSNLVTIFWVIIFTVIVIAADTLTVMIPTRLFNIDVTHILAEGTLRIPFTLMYIFILAFLAGVLLCFSPKQFRLSRFQQAAFLFFSLLFIVIEKLLLVSQISAYDGNIEPFQKFIYAVFFSVMILFVSLLIYIYNLGIEKEKNLRLTEVKIQAEMEQKQYEQVVSSLSELRYMKHDINNHLSTLQNLISKEHYNEAVSYIDNLTQSISNSYVTLATGNNALDSIITNKLTRCKSHHIKVNYSVHYPSAVPLADYEICSLIGNLFDNAIEACLTLSNTDNREIQFNINPYNEMLSISMVNSSNGVYEYTQDKQLASTKKDFKIYDHGLGLKRISQIVTEYEGIVDICPKNREFKVRILIPLLTHNQTDVLL